MHQLPNDVGEPTQFEVRVPVLGGGWFDTYARRAGPNRFAVTHTFRSGGFSESIQASRVN